MVDLNKIDWNAKDLKIISMQEPETAQDVSDTAKQWTPRLNEKVPSGNKGARNLY